LSFGHIGTPSFPVASALPIFLETLLLLGKILVLVDQHHGGVEMRNAERLKRHGEIALVESEKNRIQNMKNETEARNAFKKKKREKGEGNGVKKRGGRGADGCRCKCTPHRPGELFKAPKQGLPR